MRLTTIFQQTPGLLEHSLRTFFFCRQVIDYLPESLLTRQQERDLLTAALYHDIGKSTWLNEWFSLPKYSIRNQDWTVMQMHPIQTINLATEHSIKTIDLLNDMPIPITEGTKRIILQHHERPGGTGYPYGIEPDLVSVIFAAVDVFSACIESRPYREYPLSTEQALREVARFAPEIVVSALKHSLKKMAA